MPTDKDLKRLVRARMRKTGEAYTAARAQIIKKPRAKTVSAVAAIAPAEQSNAKDYAVIAGTSDAIIKEKTGCTWEKRVYALDRRGAAEMPHREIAALISTKYKVGGWYSQMVAVGYERIKGLRARGQRRDGTYEASKSRTYNVAVTTLFETWADPSLRRRWLGEPGVKVRTAKPAKTMRLGWPDGTIVVIGFTPKGKSKSQVALAHTKLPDPEAVKRVKLLWSARLDALGKVLIEPEDS